MLLTVVADGGFCCIPGSHKAMYPCPISIKRLEAATDEANRAMRHIPVRAGDMFVFTEVRRSSGNLALSVSISVFVSVSVSVSASVSGSVSVSAFISVSLSLSRSTDGVPRADGLERVAGRAGADPRDAALARLARAARRVHPLPAVLPSGPVQGGYAPFAFSAFSTVNACCAALLYGRVRVGVTPQNGGFRRGQWAGTWRRAKSSWRRSATSSGR
jgi:hypothetical protein